MFTAKLTVVRREYFGNEHWKSRLAAQRIEERVGFDESNVVSVTVLAGFLKQSVRLIGVSESHLDDGKLLKSQL